LLKEVNEHSERDEIVVALLDLWGHGTSWVCGKKVWRAR